MEDLKVKELVEMAINSKNYDAISTREIPLVSKLLENQIKHMNEQTFSGDLAALGQILVPVFRRAFPMLIGKDIVGVQPLTQPIGYVFALRYSYTGNTKGNALVGITPVGGKKFTSPYETSYMRDTVDAQRNNVTSAILVYSSSTTRLVDAPDVGYGATPLALTGDLAGLGYCIYSETNKAVIYATSANLTTIKAMVGATGVTIVDYYDNEAAFLNVLKNYPGPLATLTGERLEKDMDEIGLTIDKISVEAKTRKLKARYTLEAAQDMKAIHGKDMANELIDILSFEVAQSIDRDIIDTINSVAPTTSIDISTLDGRWENEKFRVFYSQLLRRSNDIAKTTMRGPGNILIASTEVCTMLEQLPMFALNAVQGNLSTNKPVNQTGQAYVGTLGGRFAVYRDIFAASDYVTVAYKGSGNYDSGVIWSPYIPLEMKKVVEPDNANPAIIFLERSAISANIFGAPYFYRKINVSNIF